VILVGPYDGLTNALLSQFATATLIDQPMRLAGSPFRLYIVTLTTAASSSRSLFTGHLQLLDPQAKHLSFNGSPWLVTRWTLLRSEQPSFRTTYSYVLTALPHDTMKQRRQSLCTFTAIRAGDQLLVAISPPDRSSVPTSVTVTVQSFMTTPNTPFYGPFHLETDSDGSTPWITLQTADGRTSMTIPAS
jgi:hypothetical protein